MFLLGELILESQVDKRALVIFKDFLLYSNFIVCLDMNQFYSIWQRKHFQNFIIDCWLLVSMIDV